MPTYIGCTVCIEWNNFQNFAGWFNENYIEGYDLDKDIKVNGNKVYSPVTCLIVTPKENTIKARAKSYRLTSPEGDIIDIYNMAEFCRDNSLCKANMSAVHRGCINQHKGWTKA